MNHSTPGLPVHHQLLEFTQTHVHRVGDAIQPSHPPSSPCWKKLYTFYLLVGIKSHWRTLTCYGKMWPDIIWNRNGIENELSALDWDWVYNWYTSFRIFSSVQFSRSVVSDSLQPHELQHTRPPCLSPTPGVYPNSCPLSQWCHPAISFSVIPFSSCSNPSQHQGLFQWVNSSHEVAKVLEFQLQQQSFQWTPRTDLL